MNARPTSFSRQAALRTAMLHASIVFLVVSGVASSCRAQCQLQVLPGQGLPGVDGTVNAAISWDPDGGGPLAPLTVVAGTFAFAGSVAANNIAAYDHATGVWSAFGSGTNGVVAELAVLGNGRLVACGNFATAGGVPANGIAAWDGSAWQALGSGTNGVVRALLELPNGDLIAGGNFTLAGGIAAQGVARWDGVMWSAVGAPAGLHGDGGVACLAALPNGDLVAGGNFSPSFGAVAHRVARFDGTTWSAMGAGMNRAVWTFHVRPNGELLAGGEFTLVGASAVNRIARWTGTAWAPLGSGITWSLFPPVTAYVAEIVTLPGGDVMAGGFFSHAGGLPAYCMARWNGTTWSPYALGAVGVTAMLVLPDGSLLASHHPGIGVAVWNGTTWVAMGSGIGSTVFAATALPGGDAVVGGSFTSAGGQRVDCVARWSNGVFSPLGSGMNGEVQALATLPGGDVVAGGAFTTAGGVSANRIARWDGSTWSPLGLGFTVPNIAEVWSLLPLPNGDVIAGGWITATGATPLSFIARWDGTAWSSLGTGVNNIVYALARLPNGDIVAGGAFQMAGGVPANFIARWNGAAWLPMGNGMNGGVEGLAVRADGQLVAVGSFTVAGSVLAPRVARWDGTTWWPVGSGLDGIAKDVVVLPGGDLIVSGEFTQAGGAPALRLARYGAAGWSALGSGVTGTAPLPIVPSVEAVELLADDRLLLGGTFLTVHGQPSANVAAIASSCPATAASYGSGCAGAGGTNVLTATALPWLGSTFRAQANGMPSIGLLASVHGFAQVAIPIAAVLPQGLPGCLLHASPDLVGASLSSGSTLDTAIALPLAPSLAGLSLFHFVVAFEFDTQGFTAITSTNGLAAVLGAM
ncbi:MAG TPA: hypothetical protein VF384_14585 [Planctomycetota bacterium]